MIVVDTNVLAAFCLASEKTDIAQKVWARDSVWHAPLLWASEFRNVLALYQRRGIADADTCLEVMRQARAILPASHTHRPDDDLVLELAFQSGCAAYDCEFVAVAKHLRKNLLTWDAVVLKSFPDVAFSPEAFLDSPP